MHSVFFQTSTKFTYGKYHKNINNFKKYTYSGIYVMQKFTEKCYYVYIQIQTWKQNYLLIS